MNLVGVNSPNVLVYLLTRLTKPILSVLSVSILVVFTKNTYSGMDARTQSSFHEERP